MVDYSTFHKQVAFGSSWKNSKLRLRSQDYNKNTSLSARFSGSVVLSRIAVTEKELAEELRGF